MAVRLERAHAEFVGEGESLLVVGDSGLDLRGLTLRRNVAKQVQSIDLIAAFLVRMGERKGTLGEGVGFLQAAHPHLCLPQSKGTECLIADHVLSHGLFHHRREQQHGVGTAPG